ncbi:MAG: hypothetical protein M3N50_02800, partial [Pseudomonadota bacterium]|nr:hypothetical protein [Pseudomonadota bacterium]
MEQTLDFVVQGNAQLADAASVKEPKARIRFNGADAVRREVPPLFVGETARPRSLAEVVRLYQRFALHPSGETPIATALSLIYVTDNTTRERGNMTVIRSLVRTAPALWGWVTALTLWVAVTSNAWGGPIDDIVKRGGVKIGVLSGVPLYGTVDAKGEPAGYDIDVANVL